MSAPAPLKDGRTDAATWYKLGVATYAAAAGAQLYLHGRLEPTVCVKMLAAIHLAYFGLTVGLGRVVDNLAVDYERMRSDNVALHKLNESMWKHNKALRSHSL